MASEGTSSDQEPQTTYYPLIGEPPNAAGGWIPQLRFHEQAAR